MKFVICLGNPGDKYAKTRHNIGFMFADVLCEKIGARFSVESKFKAHIAKGVYNNEAIWIVKPQTFMNLSGESLNLLKSFYKIDINDLFLVYDDIALNLGVLRFRPKGSAGGHNGVKSIIQYASTDVFHRLKIGIGPQPPFMKSEDFVLQNFSFEDSKLLQETVNKSVNSFLYYLENGIDKAQNIYNR